MKKPFTMDQVMDLFANTEGLVVQDNVSENIYPMPRFAHGKDDVFVGRIRRDESNDNTLDIWVVADNLRKGAATNAVQIAQVLLQKNLVSA
jgi:aspartate-semialdehyde dehydrogenase